MVFDILIKNGRIIDGSGAPAFTADMGITDGRIAAYGNLTGAEARQVIDAKGYTVTPGFIDIHRHADAEAYRAGYGELELAQGLTTIVNGNCGLSAAPLTGPFTDEIKAYLRPITGGIGDNVPTRSMKEYLDGVKDAPIHSYMLVGAGTVRAGIAGYKKLRLDDEDYTRIHRTLEQALSEGALGVSLGLGYAPECFYTTEELIRALEPLRDTDIPFTVHMRQEGSGVVESVKEMLSVGRALNCPVHISHLKAMGRINWGKKIPEALRLMAEARGDGLDVSCDVYPYTAGSTQLMHILPQDMLEGGTEAALTRLKDPAVRKTLSDRIEEKVSDPAFDNIAKLAGWEGIYVTSVRTDKNKIYQGKSIADIAADRGVSELDACCDLLIEEDGMVTMIDSMASEDDIEMILRDPRSCLISDSTYPTEGLRHPRVYGTFTRMIEHFVLEKHTLSLEKAIEKMTYGPAAALRIPRKGLIKENYDADICIFRPEDLHECATYTDPHRLSAGMRAVIVGGRLRSAD
ncbi:MAG: amidohydrolase family protein [Lachnospiraceae bacterium]|nr:amidohydrolase family protein [Lachnospiraceae bacterium]